MAKWLVASVLVVAGVAHSDPPAAAPVPAKPAPARMPGAVAADVLRAIAAKDDAALAGLAAKDEPDPWRVADELCVLGEHDAALAFARAAPRRDVESLPAYVDSRRGKSANPPARETCDASVLASADHANETLRALDAVVLLPDDPITNLRVAQGRAIALWQLRRCAESVEAYGTVAKIAKSLGWHSRVSIALWGKGQSAAACKDFHGALDAWQERLALEEARGNRRGLAGAHGLVANALNQLGEVAQALDHRRRALALDEEVGDRKRIAQDFVNISVLLEQIGDFDGALHSRLEALPRFRDLAAQDGGAESMDTMGRRHTARGDAAAILDGIGGLYAALGDYPKSLEFRETALKEMEAIGDSAPIARVLTDTGTVYHALGDDVRALGLYERALALMEANGDRYSAAVTRGNMAIIYTDRGDLERALSLQERAFATKTELGDPQGAATTLANLGAVHAERGDYTKAIEAQERALKLHRDLGARAGVAATLLDLGLTRSRMGQHDEASRLFAESADGAREIKDVPHLAGALKALAKDRLDAGDPTRALSAAKEAVREVAHLVGGLGVEEGAGAREQFAEVFDVGAESARRLGAPADLTFFLESGRAAALLHALGGRERLRETAIPDDLRMAEARTRAQEALAVAELRQVLDRGDLDELRRLRKAIDAAQVAVEDAVARIQRSVKSRASVVYPKADELKDIQSRLGDAESLVLYASPSENALAFVVTATTTRVVPLGPSTAIDEACEAGDWAALRRLVVDPLALGDKTRRLLVSPAGALAYAPFCAMTDREVAYVPSGTAYGVLLDERAKRGTGVLALGDPDYQTIADARAVALVRGGATLAALPATRDEAKSVGDVVLLGAEATGAGLVAKAASRSRWRAVHFACHGLVNRERPQFSSLALAGGELLTMLDVFRSQLPSDLVVLSACETGLGKVYKTEGVVGFVQAFLFAGSPRVIVSLWKVDDEATRALMTKFYALWNPRDGSKPMGTAAALKAAQEFVRSEEKWKNPTFWAAWQLWGLPE